MASGDDLIFIKTLNYERGTLGVDLPAIPDTRNNIPVLDFLDGDTANVTFGLFLPAHYDGGGIDVTLGWMATAATTGDVRWQMFFHRIEDDADDFDTLVFASSGSLTATTASVSGEVDYATKSIVDNLVRAKAGEYFLFKLRRNGASAPDTMSGDAELLFIAMSES